MKKLFLRSAAAALALVLTVVFTAATPPAPATALENLAVPEPYAVMTDIAPVAEPYVPVMSSGGSLHVTGRGTVICEPDIAYFSLGVQTEAKEAGDAARENARLMTAVLAAVKASGVAEKDLQTKGYSIYPQYNYQSGKDPLITGYRAVNNVSVTLRDITLVSKVLDAAVGAGANYSGGISFGVADREGAYLAAMEAALENARQKGEVLAASFGAELGMPLEITEQSGYMGYETIYKEYAAAAPMAGDSVSTPVETGELEITATLTVTYGYTK